MDLESTRPIENNRPIERRGEPSAFNKAENRKSANKIKKRLTAYLVGKPKDSPDDLVLNEANNSVIASLHSTLNLSFFSLHIHNFMMLVVAIVAIVLLLL